MAKQDLHFGTHRFGVTVGAALFVVLGIVAPVVAGAQHSSAHGASDHEARHHSAEIAPELEEPGNAAFAAIQEVVEALTARSDTDWSRVDLEALRRHLIDMRRFTLEAEIVSREPVPGGLRVTVRGTSSGADASIGRAVRAHAPMLREETGWRVAVENSSEGIGFEVTGDTEGEAERIRGLGYIGWMTTGTHHREHHWRIATGEDPHRHEAH